MLRALKLILTLHCDESEHLISRSLDERLPWVERWALRLHFLSCWSCRRVKQQLILLHTAARQRGRLSTAEGPQIGEPSDGRFQLSDEARRRIETAIEAGEETE